MSNLTANHEQTAKILGISGQALWKAVKERGCPAGKKDGRQTIYSLPEVVAWRIADVTARDLDLNAERARLAKEQADKLSRENAQARGESLTHDEVVNAWADQIGNARSKLLALPTKVAPYLTNISDPTVIAAAVRVEVYAALTELSTYEPEGGSGDEGGEPPVEAAAAADGERVGGRKQKAESREQR